MVRFDPGKEHIRDAMLAIVLDHPQNRPDFVQGKGEARVILLHGKITNDREVKLLTLSSGQPGSGKTYTVGKSTASSWYRNAANFSESIAKETKRPMLSLTVADLGTKEEILERRLSSWFRLAETWKAIMLLDEADVFLEDRKHGELQRNCLVSGEQHCVCDEGTEYSEMNWTLGSISSDDGVLFWYSLPSK
jgi:hypothetical protein